MEPQLSTQNRPVMSQREMFNTFIWDPFAEAFQGLFSEPVLIAHGVLAIVGITATTIGLVETPEVFYMGLLLLVIFDWVSGMLVAAGKREFDIRVAVRKLYHVAAYICVCLPATIMANMVIMELGPESTFGLSAYYFHFAVYLAFAAKEFVSLLRTWKLLEFFILVWEMIKEKDLNLDGIRDLGDDNQDRE